MPVDRAARVTYSRVMDRFKRFMFDVRPGDPPCFVAGMGMGGIESARIRLGKKLTDKGIDPASTLSCGAIPIIAHIFADSPERFEQALGKLEILVAELASKGIDPRHILEFDIRAVAEVVNSPKRFYLVLDFASRLANKGIDPGPALRYGIPEIERAFYNSPKRYDQALDLALRLADKGIDPLNTLRFLSATLYKELTPTQTFDLLTTLAQDLLAFCKKGLELDLSSEKISEIFKEIIKESAILGNLTPAQIYELALKCLANPQLAGFAASLFARLEKIEFRDGGNSPATYAGFAEPFTRSAEIPKDAPEIDTSLPIQEQEMEAILKSSGIPGLAFHKAMGRTLLFRGQNGQYLAVKLLKEGEEIESLEREAGMLRYFNSHKDELGLRSEYPSPLGVFRVKGIKPDMESAIVSSSQKAFTVAKDIRRNFPHTALVYTADKDYFIYLNDPSLSEVEFQASSFTVLNDLFSLARRNIIHFALIELFHNLIQPGRTDRGRYLWMVSLVRPMATRQGTGRLHGWTGTVRFPNLRRSGLADLADAAPLGDLLQPDNPASIHLSGLSRFKENAPNFYLASYLGDYLLAWSLITASRFSKLGLLDWHDRNKVASLAATLRGGFSQAFSVFTGIPAEAAESFLGSLINWERISLQMNYFMTPAYIEGLTKRNVPEEIYGRSVEVDITSDLEDSRGWTDRGWSFDGETPDLGPVNGPIPLQELIKALYLSTGFMLALRKDPAA